MPAAIAGHGFATADNVNRNNGDVGSGGNHANSRFGFSKFAIKSSLAFREKNESSFVFKNFEDVF